MKTLSIKQPWAYLIACGLKDIENRTWKTKYRGKILIHTSSKSDNEPYQLFTDEQWDEIEKNQMDPEVFNSYKDLGMIIGEVDIVDCVINHESIWAEKTHYPLNIGKLVSVKDICEQHILEDYRHKFIPTPQDFIEGMEFKEWMQNGRGSVPSSTKLLYKEKDYNKLIEN